MNKNMYVFDVGNTLIYKPNNSMHSSLVEDLLNLQKSGSLIGIATMRNLTMLNELLKQVRFDFLIALNGAYVKCDDRILLDDPITDEDLNFILDFLKKNNIKHKLYSKYTATSYFNEEKVYVIELFNCSNIVNQIEYYFSNYNLHIWKKGETIDLNCLKVSKEAGFQKVCQYLKVSPINCFAFGDGFNDVGLFNICGTSIAMGSAPKEIKQRASFVTKSAMNNGVSWALKHYPL